MFLTLRKSDHKNENGVPRGMPFFVLDVDCGNLVVQNCEKYLKLLGYSDIM
jgi:hypothetical protein